MSGVQAQLNDEFSTFVDTYQKKQQSGQGKRSPSSKKSRRAKKAKSDSNSTSTAADSGNQDSDSGPDEETVTLKRIRTQKSRRVITERRA